MTERPAFHCGALDCCEGAQYPECQASPITLGIDANGELQFKYAHYDDDATGQDQCPCTD